jgi:hypothetical protein
MDVTFERSAKAASSRVPVEDRLRVIACGAIAREILAVTKAERARPCRSRLPAGDLARLSAKDRAGDARGDR